MEAAMPKFLLLTGALLLMPGYAFAQAPSADQCQQIKQAVAQYGYAAARKHALETYGPDAVKVGDQCFAGHHRAAYAGHRKTAYKKHSNGASRS
jgi:hypothetical protein